MNKKQLVSMWVGIVAIVWAGSQEAEVFYVGGHDVDWGNFLLWAILIALVTGGLIYTFKDKKPKDEQKQ